MDFRIGYRRPLRTASLLRQKRQWIRLWVAAAMAIATVVAMAWNRTPSVVKTTVASAPVALASADPQETHAMRRVYPFSVVPGGVVTRAELQQRVNTDPVVARHYASFDINKAHAIGVNKARAVYVSYRKGDKVYWTANKVMLTAGETVLSDGSSEIRGRCGNRISDTAQLPVAMDEPSEEQLDASMTVAMDPDAEGGWQNANMNLDEGLPTGSATQFQHIASLGQSDAAPVSPATRDAMPAMPAYSSGIPGVSSRQATRLLAASPAPVSTADQSTEPAATVAPDPSSGTPATDSAVPASTITPATPAPTTTPPGAGPTTPTVPPKTPLPEGEVPEPATLWLSGAACFAMLLAGRRDRRAARAAPK